MIRIALPSLLLFLSFQFGQAQMIQLENLFGQYQIRGDACGTNALNCQITIEKPAGATTVHRAYVYYSTMAISPDQGPTPITFSGTSIVTTNLNLPNVTSAGDPNGNFPVFTRYQDYTSLFAPGLNALMAGGTMSYTSTEANSNSIDGVGMIVIWNNPTVPNTVVHLSIGSANTGTLINHNITTPPINTSLPAYRAVCGMGYIFSTASGSQINTCRINGTTIDTNAGGYDDGGLFNGGLITLGGFGDTWVTGPPDEYYNISALIAMNSTNLNYQVIKTTTHNSDWLDVFYLEIVNDVPLPIELAAFDATLVDDAVQLDWITTEELNNDYFIIQRSADGELFENIERIEGQGNSSATHTYQVYDYQPLAGKSWYRLGQVDKDGVMSFSEAREIIYEPAVSITIFPNPARNQFSFRYNGELDNVLMTVYDARGNQVIARQYDALAQNAEHSVQTRDLAAGIYMVKFVRNGKQQIHRLVIER